MSQMSGVEIVRMRRGQFAAAREMLTRAFLDYPLMMYANAQLAHRRRGVATLYGAILRDTLRHGEVHVSAGLEGVCCWLPPGVGLPTFAREVRSGMLGLPFGFGWAGFQRLVNFDHVQRRCTSVMRSARIGFWRRSASTPLIKDVGLAARSWHRLWPARTNSGCSATWKRMRPTTSASTNGTGFE